jgi:hypothetical protein
LFGYSHFVSFSPSHFVSFSPSQLEQTAAEMWDWLKESPSSDCLVHRNIGKISILKRQQKHAFELSCGTRKLEQIKGKTITMVHWSQKVEHVDNKQ